MLARKQQKKPISEKFISPTTDMAHPAATKAVGKMRQVLNGSPRNNTMATVTRQPVVLMTSVKAADETESASFPAPIDTTTENAMGKSMWESSWRLGKGKGALA